VEISPQDDGTGNRLASLDSDKSIWQAHRVLYYLTANLQIRVSSHLSHNIARGRYVALEFIGA